MIKKLLSSKMLIAVVSLLFSVMAHATSITYRIVEFNNSTGMFTLAPCGLKPYGSFAVFENDYGATIGNRYNQIPRNKQAALTLYGWDDCTIESITFSMCSNSKAGTVGYQLTFDGEVQAEMRPVPFNSPDWFGRWVDKNHVVFVDVTKEIASRPTVPEGAETQIILKAGTDEGSVYIDSFTIEYTPGKHVTLENPLGWKYEKIEAKGKLTEGDVVIMYRSGAAAGEIGNTMDEFHYLDVVPVLSTANVDDPDISLFTVNQVDGGAWTFTNQYGEQLGAAGEKYLTWDEGVTTWNVSFGYDGATIASTNEKYGTMRYNVPIEGYARFSNYTSKSLPLPLLYRRGSQQQPVTSTKLILSSTLREDVKVDADTILFTHKIEPANVTDHRVAWSSSDEEVAVVRSGIVEIKGEGEAIIRASCMDGGSTATCHIVVTDEGGVEIVGINDGDKGYDGPYYDIYGRKYATKPEKGFFINSRGEKILK